MVVPGTTDCTSMLEPGLSTMASGVGRPLYPDAITRACTRLDFACVCVMLDISSKLPKHLILMMPKDDGSEVPCKVDVEYEWRSKKQDPSPSNGAAVIPPTEENVQPSTQTLIDNSGEPPCKSIDKVWNVRGLNRRDHQVAVADLVADFSAHLSVLATIIYGANDHIVRRELWQQLGVLSQSIDDEPWVVGGDFNTVLDMSEVCGSSVDIHVQMNEFRDCIHETGLIQLPMQGELFTWHNCSEGDRSLWKRLDRLLVNDAWLRQWPNSCYQSLNARTSDHSPLLIRGDDSTIHSSMFRFDNYIALSSEFLPSVQNVWQHRIEGTTMYAVTRKLRALKPVFRRIRRNKGDLSLNVKLAAEFLSTKLEQMMLQQRAKIQWLKGGRTHTSKEDVVNEFVSFYRRLLGGERRREFIDLRYLRPWVRHVITQEEASALIQPVSREEIKLAFFDIEEDKAPGPDGYSSGFYKAAWPIIGEEITNAILEFFTTGRLLKQVNTTLLALIPKICERHTIQLNGIFYLRCFKCLGFRTHLFAGLRNVSPPYVLDLYKRDSTRFFKGARGLRQADIPSVTVFKRGLEEFAKLSGLRANPQKSQMILSRSAFGMRESLLNILGFPEGHLPLRYLGLPLLSSRLTISDCQPLLIKIDSRIKGWEGIQLSFAGRLQLIKSVLLALNIYWAMAFILPKGVIKEVEKRLRGFLWKGHSNEGYPKVAWNLVCRPIEEVVKNP
ncbi:UNVERIFIED_CONTAM: hypothetical protein Slati_0874100 [Sesamum latifolium]|uniref:Reverse transcriptase n=1 Tax=Sesamum latifolium TaxID=2727402 RepID=A0AAW2XN68_9LAMI